MSRCPFLYPNRGSAYFFNSDWFAGRRLVHICCRDGSCCAGSTDDERRASAIGRGATILRRGLLRRCPGRRSSPSCCIASSSSIIAPLSLTLDRHSHTICSSYVPLSSRHMSCEQVFHRCMCFVRQFLKLSDVPFHSCLDLVCLACA